MNGFYIHIPFCLKKCNYCDFASYPSVIDRRGDYINALCRDIETYRGAEVNTLYFGGGTPSLLCDEEMNRIMECIHTNLILSPQSEITLEANPCTVDKKKAVMWQKYGVNRISLGTQSFIDNELKILGRLHNTKDSINAYRVLREYGFNNISLDIMYALPEQDMSSLSTSVNQMLKLSPDHISCYGLKIEEGTPFYDMKASGIIREHSDDSYADMYDYLCDVLKSEGYCQYELSNFSKPGFESKHNIKYWTRCDYIGVGLSAASCYKGNRYTKTSDFEAYIKNRKNEEYISISDEDSMSEFMILSLRLTQIGANKNVFRLMFGKNIEDVFADVIDKHVANGLVLDRGDRYVLSSKAYYISNSVLCDFV